MGSQCKKCMEGQEKELPPRQQFQQQRKQYLSPIQVPPADLKSSIVSLSSRPQFPSSLIFQPKINPGWQNTEIKSKFKEKSIIQESNPPVSQQSPQPTINIEVDRKNKESQLYLPVFTSQLKSKLLQTQAKNLTLDIRRSQMPYLSQEMERNNPQLSIVRVGSKIKNVENEEEEEQFRLIDPRASSMKASQTNPRESLYSIKEVPVQSYNPPQIQPQSSLREVP